MWRSKKNKKTKYVTKSMLPPPSHVLNALNKFLDDP